MSRRLAGDRSIAMRLRRHGPVVSEHLADPNILCAQVDAKLFGRLRLLSLEVRVVAGKPPEVPAADMTPRASRRSPTLERNLRGQESTSDLSRAVELW
ncbi:MAG: hypothetical protein ABI586_04170, partial [Candidatus Nanopelagicales bacterium]